MRKVEKITVDNESGFVLNFSVQWLSSDGKWNTTEWSSGNYPVAQSRTTPPLDKIGVPADAVAVTPYGHAVGGISGQGTPFLTFESNDRIATYEAIWTPLIGFKITLIE
ncbi:hypothetical protein AU476_21735 [Cupriavidus sp. UYMSc13B]|nr:hypothetical protein AU476_21735 [Cupriavidus sp. UYMSc13B]